MILVAGGTGRLGRLVVDQLAARGGEVRVLARHAAGVRMFASGVEGVVGDVRNRADIERAMDGVDVVVSAVQGFVGKGGVSPQSVDRDGNVNLIDAAVVRSAHVVLVSVIGASPKSPMELFRAKWDAEQHLAASGIPFTVVRAAAFVETWADVLQRAPIFGRGDNPINFVSVHDVAHVVADAATDRAPRGAVIEVAGPDTISFNQFVDTLRHTTGRPTRVRHVPRPVLRITAPLSRLSRAALVMDTEDLTRHGRNPDQDSAPTDVTTALTRL
jgi:uncharacterized protein YbjT (DUF2867 family)